MERDKKFDPQFLLGDKITKFSRRELCEFGAALCRQIKEDAGPGNYRGGVCPENISLDEQGNIAIGPAKSEGWEGQEVDFVSPELFWNGQGTSAADVYAVGMLLYYGASGGRLPFDEFELDAARARRMNGEAFTPPKAAGRRLGEIIAKATAFKTGDRYKSVGEIEAMLNSCVKNLYLSGAPSAELLFNKNDDDLSDMERLMVSIIEKPDEEPEAEEEVREEPVLEIAPETGEEAAENETAELPAEEPQAGEEQPEETAAVMPELPDDEAEAAEVEAPAEEPAVEKAEESEAPRQPVVQLFEEKNPELEPVVPSRPITPAVQYGKSIERERKIAEEVKKRKRRPLIFILLLCALLIIVAIIVNAINRDNEPGSPLPEDEQIEVVPPVPTAPQESEEPGAEEPQESQQPDEPEEPKVSSYQLFIEDVSWTEARDRCIEKGGHLVVISDGDELKKVTDLADQYGVKMLWVGCHRVEGALQWESGEDVGFYPWGSGEPSYMDAYDGAYEDYLLLWYNNGWSYNDSRNDPVADYPSAYSGKIAYVCEFEG